VVILGGGLCGLSAALHLSQAGLPWLLLEKEARVGGHARTDETRGFHFDKTGHWLHLRDPGIQQLVRELLPDQLVRVERKARIFSHGVLTRYPFQANLHGLPPAVVSECLLEFLAAAAGRTQSSGSDRPRNFEEFCLANFGAGISRHFMIPYNQKLWGVHPREITAEWCSRFVPIPKLEDVVRGAVGDVPPEMGYNVAFLYPQKGGIETLTRALARRVEETRGSSALHTGTVFDSIDTRARTVTIGGEPHAYRAVVASVPLPELVARIVDAPREITEAAGRLRCTTLRYLNVATKSSPRADFHWIYVPEERFPFYRVGIYSNAVPAMAPAGRGSLYVELSDRRADLKLDEILPDVTQALAAAGAINGVDDLLFAELKELKYAYVVFDDAYYDSVGQITR
jgi:protoporphyrinogen oxidase